MKNNGDVDDDVYDWNLLNGGKGWEASLVRNPFPPIPLPYLKPLPLSLDRTRQLIIRNKTNYWPVYRAQVVPLLLLPPRPRVLSKPIVVGMIVREMRDGELLRRGTTTKVVSSLLHRRWFARRRNSREISLTC